MGLDMYLTVERFVWHSDEELKAKIKSLNLPGTADLEPKTIVFEAAYWRKDNQIHGWFVDHVQDGKDDCGTYGVTTAQLAELLRLCRQVKAEPERAQELLPPRQGFFFGGYEIDEDYWSGIDDTITVLDKLLNEPGLRHGWEFSYHSSW